jgi:hypothetical protein
MESIIAQIKQTVPNLIGALLVLVIGWVLALLASRLVGTALRQTNLERKLGKWLGGRRKRRQKRWKPGSAKACSI